MAQLMKQGEPQTTCRYAVLSWVWQMLIHHQEYAHTLLAEALLKITNYGKLWLASSAHHLLQAVNIEPECVVHISLLRVMSSRNHRSPGGSS
jgi:hypothetical protein